MAKPSDAEIVAWSCSPSRMYQIAAWLAAWARDKPSGYPLPSCDRILAHLDFVASEDTIRRAKRDVLAKRGVLAKTPGQPYFVA